MSAATILALSGSEELAIPVASFARITDSRFARRKAHPCRALLTMRTGHADIGVVAVDEKTSRGVWEVES